MSKKSPPPRQLSLACGRLLPLDSLRGFAAILIAFVYHAGHRGFDVPSYFPDLLAGPIRYLGGHGGEYVHLFFMLSGVVFYYNYRKKIEKKQIDLQEFVLLRFSRLYPSCWLNIIVQACIMFYWQVTYGGNPYNRFYRGSIYEFVLSALFINTTSTTMLSPAFNPVLWTVSYEIILYFIFFFVASISGRKNGILLYIFPILLGLVSANGRAGAVGDMINATGFICSYGQVLIDFFTGCLLSEFYMFIRDKQSAKAVGYSALPFVVLIPVLDNFYPEILGDTLGVFQFVWYPAIILSILCISRLFQFLSLKPFQWLGKLSFSIYIWHLPIMDIIELLLLRMGLPEYVSSKRVFAIWFISTLILSWISYTFFERPFQKRIRNKYYGWRERKAIQ